MVDLRDRYRHGDDFGEEPGLHSCGPGRSAGFGGDLRGGAARTSPSYGYGLLWFAAPAVVLLCVVFGMTRGWNGFSSLVGHSLTSGSVWSLPMPRSASDRLDAGVGSVVGQASTPRAVPVSDRAEPGRGLNAFRLPVLPVTDPLPVRIPAGFGSYAALPFPRDTVSWFGSKGLARSVPLTLRPFFDSAELHYVVTVRAWWSNRLVAIVYLDADSMVAVDLPAGRYRVAAAWGRAWGGSSVLFGVDTSVTTVVAPVDLVAYRDRSVGRVLRFSGGGSDSVTTFGAPSADFLKP